MTEMKGKRNSSAMITGNFNALLSIIARTSREIVEKEIANLNNTMNQRGLSYVHKIPHPSKTEYTFSRIGYIF